MEYLDSFDTFLKNYNTKSGIYALNRFSAYLDTCKVGTLTDIIYHLFKKYPGINNKEIIALGIKRKIQSNFYAYLYNSDQPEDLRKKDEMIFIQLALTDIKNTNLNHYPKPKKVMPLIKEIKVKEVKEVRVKREPPSDEISVRCRESTIEQLVVWAKELNISEEKIKKHESKGKGLAKMYLGLIIKGAIK